MMTRKYETKQKEINAIFNKRFQKIILGVICEIKQNYPQIKPEFKIETSWNDFKKYCELMDMVCELFGYFGFDMQKWSKEINLLYVHAYEYNNVDIKNIDKFIQLIKKELAKEK